MTNLKELLENAGVQLTPAEELKEEERLAAKHRSASITERPKEEVSLQSLSTEDVEIKKTQKDPTEDLVLLPRTWDNNELWLFDSGYLIWCPNEEEVYYAPTKLCLDANFIYREDLEVKEFQDRNAGEAWYKEKVADLMPGIITCKSCYILDNPANESYEVYYDSNYPTLKYGKATPSGMFIHKYKNRFHRDMAILELDELYSNSSAKKAGLLTKKELKSNEAIVISDGCWMKEVCSNAYYYLDATSVVKFTQAILPSEPDQAVLIAEILGATNALKMCRMNSKKKITYYYDNTSILNVFKNRKTEYIQEIVDYKKLLEQLHSEGYDITFVELHPKTDENKDSENKALMFFHNSCDAECRTITDIFKKDYKSYASISEKDGKSYASVKREVKPKGQPKGGYRKPGQDYRPR